MPLPVFFRISLVAMCFLWAASQASPAAAQLDLSGIQVGGAAKSAEEGPPYKLSAEIKPAAGDQPVQLAITAKLSPGWRTYSITQPPGGPVRTKITVNPGAEFKLASDFKAEPKPAIKFDEVAYKDLPLETHTGTVTWTAPLELSPGVDISQLKITGKVLLQVCDDQTCLPPAPVPFQAALAAPSVSAVAPPSAQPVAAQAPSPTIPSVAIPPITIPGLPAVPGVASLGTAAGVYVGEDTHVTIRGHLQPPSNDGNVAKLVLTAEPTGGFHVYALAEKDPKALGEGKPTLIQLTDTSGLRFKRPVISDTTGAESKAGTPYYTAPVTWTIEIEVPPSLARGNYPISGLIGFNTCKETCDRPHAAAFNVTLPLGSAASEPIPLTFAKAKYAEVAKLADKATASQSSAAPAPAASVASAGSAPPEAVSLSLPVVILFSLLGGMILNVMPCVLPVIGLKILSFVEQGGHNRGRIVTLNVWYSLGLLSVFMVLATLSVSLNLGWGQQFGSTAFNVVMVGVLFVMALSFLGVWEIPIPGFVGSGKANELAGREGIGGAFAKGVLTTVLATPCSGPFLGPVFGYTLKQPSYVTFVVFGCIGLGMALPYLIIGAFPRLIKFLPKPGEWMDTFKQMLAFVLLGTIVYMFTFLNKNYLVPTFAMLVGLWAGCWWIGRTPLWADFHRKALAYAQGSVFAGLVGWFAFTSLVPGVAGKSDLAWREFSPTTLAQLTREGKTVMVDFTADWCPNCKWNLKLAINTNDVKNVVESTGVVPLLADWTDGSDDLREILRSLGHNEIPVLAIYPADRPNEPIILSGILTEGQVLAAIKQAGPSRAASGNQVTAMR
jgi:thiol:disulfide interchange protein/DsbC/DsbD-like thiol-disulfide interchange protein